MHRTPNIAILAAVQRDGTLSMREALPWANPEVAEYFKRKTEHASVVIGRKTFEVLLRAYDRSQFSRRRIIVLSRTLKDEYPGTIMARSWLQVLDYSSTMSHETFVIGGTSIFALALPVARTAYLTRIESLVEEPKKSEAWKSDGWSCRECALSHIDEERKRRLAFETWHRKEA